MSIRSTILKHAGSNSSINSRSLKSLKNKELVANHAPKNWENTVMRTCRQLSADGYLKRISRGEYCITPKGKKAI